MSSTTQTPAQRAMASTRIQDVHRPGVVPPLLVRPERDHAARLLAQLDGRLAELHVLAARSCSAHGLHAEAFAHLDAAARFLPRAPGWLNWLGCARYLAGDDLGAIAAFNAELAEAGDRRGDAGGEADGGGPGAATAAAHASAWFNLGMVLYGKEQFVAADECFERAVTAEPADAQLWNNRGVCLWRLERRDDARACFLRALQIDPTDRDAQFNLALCGGG